MTSVARDLGIVKSVSVLQQPHDAFPERGRSEGAAWDLTTPTPIQVRMFMLPVFGRKLLGIADSHTSVTRYPRLLRNEKATPNNPGGYFVVATLPCAMQNC